MDPSLQTAVRWSGTDCTVRDEFVMSLQSIVKEQCHATKESSGDDFCLIMAIFTLSNATFSQYRIHLVIKC